MWTWQRTKVNVLRVCREEGGSHSGEPEVTEKTEAGALTGLGLEALLAGLSPGAWHQPAMPETQGCRQTTSRGC